MSVTSIKAVRTRYRNVLCKEIDTADTLVVKASEITRDAAEAINVGTKCIKLIKCYSEKVETQMSKLTETMGEEDTESAERIVDEDCALIQHAERSVIELEELIEKLKEEERIDSLREQDDGDSVNKRLVDMQASMQQLMVTQIQQQRDFMERHEQREMQRKSSVKLPKLDMCSFDGNKLKWSQFWDAFEITVHNNNSLSQIEKFHYLQTKVVGEAKQAIEGLALSNENYRVAVTILKERFGNTQEAVDLHYRKLINIAPPSTKIESLRWFMDTVNKHLRSLEVLNENTDQHVFVSMITSKLPAEVMRQMELHKGSKTPWTVHKLREELREYILACEKVGAKDVHKPNKADMGKGPGVSTYIKPKIKSYGPPQKFEESRKKSLMSAEALTSQSESRTINNYRNKCRFCSEKHWSDECTKYRTIEERKKTLKRS